MPCTLVFNTPKLCRDKNVLSTEFTNIFKIYRMLALISTPGLDIIFNFKSHHFQKSLKYW